jgi:hypothetical protein
MVASRGGKINGPSERCEYSQLDGHIVALLKVKRSRLVYAALKGSKTVGQLQVASQGQPESRGSVDLGAACR